MATGWDWPELPGVGVCPTGCSGSGVQRSRCLDQPLGGAAEKFPTLVLASAKPLFGQADASVSPLLCLLLPNPPSMQGQREMHAGSREQRPDHALSDAGETSRTPTQQFGPGTAMGGESASFWGWQKARGSHLPKWVNRFLATCSRAWRGEEAIQSPARCWS